MEEINGVVEITPEYAYLTIPREYVCIYHKLLVYLADFGKALLDDCSASCKGNNKTVIDCWNMFQSAIACKSLGRDEEAKLFIDYIDKQLTNIYKGTDKEKWAGTMYMPITPDGKLKAVVSCSPEVQFYVDGETGELYQKYLEDTADDFKLNGDELTVNTCN